MTGLIEMTRVNSSVQSLLLDIELTKSELQKFVIPIIDKKINEHKVNHWRAWEKDHTIGSDNLKQQIKNLELQKKELLDLLDQNREDSLSLILNNK